VAKPADSVATINAALAAGLNLLLTPGVYNLAAPINVTKAGTVVLGLGLATLTATAGNAVLTTADVPGIDIAGLTIDAGEVNSPVLVQIGTPGSTADLSADPVALQDVFFRVGGPHVGKAAVCLEVNSSDTLLDHLWIWRADHGVPGSVGWTVNTSDTGLVVDGDDVTALGLFVEHFQKYNVMWNGDGGQVVFFQNELPYDPPDQASYSHDGVQGYAAFKVADDVTTFDGWGMGSYIFTNVNPDIHVTSAFEVPVTPAVRLHDVLTINLSGPGTIDHVVNTTGGPVSTANKDVASQVVEYPTLARIYSFNDFHGRITPTPALPFAYTLESAVLADPDNSMVVSAGDNVGASLFESMIAQDDPTIQLLNTLAATDGINFKASAVGNHEFDQGADDLLNRIVGGTNADGTTAPVKAAWTYLAANVVSKTTGQPILDPYYIYTLGNGLRVGVIGVVTQETQTGSLVSPAGIAGVTFLDAVTTVNKYADELKSGGLADLVVAVYHDGSQVASSLDAAITANASFAAIVNQTNANVDAIINGHTHMVYAWTGWAAEDPAGLDTHPGRAIVEAGSYGSNIGNITIALDTDTGRVGASTAQVLPLVDAKAVDLSLGSMQQISDDVTAAVAEAQVLGDQVVGAVSSDVTTAFAGGTWTAAGGTTTYQNTGSATRDNRAGESTLATLVADAFLDTANSSPQVGGADIGLINAGGGLRSELLYAPDGLVTYAEANAVLPFANNLWTIELTGAQFKQFLEEQWQTLDPTGARPTRPFLATGVSSNVTYTVNTDVTTAAPCILEAGCTWDDATSHITSVFVDGQPLDPAKTYKIMTISYLTAGGDNYRVMPAGTGAMDTGLLDRDAWIDYLMKMSGLTAINGTPTISIAPDYARASVVVSNLTPATAPMGRTTVAAGESVTASLTRLDLASLGSPANTTLTTYLVPSPETAVTAGTVLGTTAVTAPGDSAGCAAAGVPADLNPASDGCAKLDITIPAGTPAGEYTLVSVAEPSGTTVRLPITVTVTAPVVKAPTGGSVVAGSGGLAGALAVAICLGAGFALVMSTRRRQTR
ncbi:MAG: 5'-nucleotidase C-terminal domain-containing protein, partial [Propionibacteriaceae bacterium]|jgi:2',3'-cyclic-nucleotide 2'-phosphodiesterase (5'-nucleotidase family)|nr:5'-nucleotidase C-terminal domain-containing protein [Propionibacteriaceae bacterium]